MKKFTIALTVLIALTNIANAQITNNGFENWTTTGSYENPNGWATMNMYCAGPFYSCTKSSDHYPASVGNYSMRLENNTSLTQMTGAFGMAITDTMAWPFEPAFPITGNPTSLNGYFKYIPLNNDTMFIRIVFFQNSIMLGNNFFKTGINASSWTSFTIPFTFSGADSATIHISAFYPSSYTDGPNGNSVLYVDNLSFDTLIIGSVAEQSLKKSMFDLYPNPASNIINLNINNSNNEIFEINIYDVVGKLMHSEILKQNQKQINIENLVNGIYMVSVKSKSFIENQRLIIQN